MSASTQLAIDVVASTAIRTAGGLEATPDETVMILRLPGTPTDLDLDAALSAEWRRGEPW